MSDLKLSICEKILRGLSDVKWENYNSARKRKWEKWEKCTVRRNYNSAMTNGKILNYYYYYCYYYYYYYYIILLLILLLTQKPQKKPKKPKKKIFIYKIKLRLHAYINKIALASNGID